MAGAVFPNGERAARGSWREIPFPPNKSQAPPACPPTVQYRARFTLISVNIGSYLRIYHNALMSALSAVVLVTTAEMAARNRALRDPDRIHQICQEATGGEQEQSGQAPLMQVEDQDQTGERNRGHQNRGDVDHFAPDSTGVAAFV